MTIHDVESSHGIEETEVGGEDGAGEGETVVQAVGTYLHLTFKQMSFHKALVYTSFLTFDKLLFTPKDFRYAENHM